ncbi:MAG TPA: hypothetical protein VFE23_14000 [Usitatibacter sp.]|jgi:hypothetical protein|nr:hypothetical protein [Usitatibacter sp.]
MRFLPNENPFDELHGSTADSGSFRGCLAAGLFAALCVAGCASPEDTKLLGEWRVVDPTVHPHEAVPGAALLFKFVGGSGTFGHSSSVCDGATMAFADPSGTFQWPSAPMGRSVSVVAYKPGYRGPREGAIVDPSVHEVYLIKVTDKSELTRKYDHFLGQIGCINIGNQGVAIADFLEVAIPELEANAKTREDFAVLEGMKQELEITRKLSWNPRSERNR